MILSMFRRNPLAAWYVQNFSDMTLYFHPTGEVLKNGNFSGIMVEVDHTRPRAAPKAKRISVWPRDFEEPHGLWKKTGLPPQIVIDKTNDKARQ